MRKVKNPYLLKLAESFFVENEAFIRHFSKNIPRQKAFTTAL